MKKTKRQVSRIDIKASKYTVAAAEELDVAILQDIDEDIENFERDRGSIRVTSTSTKKDIKKIDTTQRSRKIGSIEVMLIASDPLELFNVSDKALDFTKQVRDAYPRKNIPRFSRKNK